MKQMTIEDVARDRLRWAKHLQKENEKLEAEVERLREAVAQYSEKDVWFVAEVKRLRKFERMYNELMDSLDASLENDWVLIEMIDKLMESDEE